MSRADTTTLPKNCHITPKKKIVGRLFFWETPFSGAMLSVLQGNFLVYLSRGDHFSTSKNPSPEKTNPPLAISRLDIDPQDPRCYCTKNPQPQCTLHGWVICFFHPPTCFFNLPTLLFSPPNGWIPYHKKKSGA